MKKLNVLAVVEANHPPAELCVIRPFTLLENMQYIRFSYTYIKTVIDTNQIDFSLYDLVVILRICSDKSVEKLLTPLVLNNIKFIYLLDDDLGDVDETVPSYNWYKSLNATSNIKKYCMYADHVIVYSHALYNKYIHYSKKISLFKGISNIEDIDVITNKYSITSKKNFIKIGYAAGPHHISNMNMVLPALKKILLLKSNVYFEHFMGKTHPSLRRLQRCRSFNPVNGLKAYYTFLASRQWDIGIAPVPDKLFFHAKSNLKYREYAAFKIAGIYSNVPTYSNYVKHNKTGLLVNNTVDDWYNSLICLINDTSKRKEIAENSYKDIKNNYNNNVIINQFIMILNDIFMGK